MKAALFRFIAFACLGITTEICFVAFSKFFNPAEVGEGGVWRLMGHTYVWMIFIYGSASFLIPWYYKFIKHFPLLVRLLAYAFGILLIEYVSGFLLEMITGRCPWKYDTGWHIHGYIRLDYIPFWMVFGWMLERVNAFLQKISVSLEEGI